MDVPKDPRTDSSLQQRETFLSRLKNKVLGIFKDTDVRKNSLQETDAVLALEASGKGAWSWHIRNDVLIWDKQMNDLFRIKSSATPVNYAGLINLIHPDDRHRVDEEFKKTLENKGSFNIIFRVVHQDKSIGFIGTKGKVCVGTQDGQQILIGVCWDMTQHQLMDEQLKTAKAQAEEASRIKSRFMAKVSHDLRSPLNGIIGFAELMYHGKVGAVSTEHKEYLGDILSSARQLLILVNDVLDIAKVESGKLVLSPEKVNLSEIANETVDIFRTLINSKNIQFDIQVDPSLKNIEIDPARLKQVIYNYVSNALKCTNDGGRVILRLIPAENNSFRVEVEDTGIGIQEQDLKRLFIEFEQIDRNIAKKYPSSGLGLAVTKHIVEIQGGSVGATSQYGKGSTFFAVLPRTPLSPAIQTK